MELYSINGFLLLQNNEVLFLQNFGLSDTKPLFMRFLVFHFAKNL